MRKQIAVNGSCSYKIRLENQKVNLIFNLIFLRCL